jgi:hypothetical protein
MFFGFIFLVFFDVFAGGDSGGSGLFVRSCLLFGDLGEGADAVALGERFLVGGILESRCLVGGAAGGAMLADMSDMTERTSDLLDISSQC